MTSSFEEVEKMAFEKKEKLPRVHQRINWKKEATMLPGYIIILVWLVFTAAFLLWILAASFSTTPEIMQGNVFKFETGVHLENYATAWQQQNVARYFGNSLLYSIVGCVFTILISAPASDSEELTDYCHVSSGCHDCPSYLCIHCKLEECS